MSSAEMVPVPTPDSTDRREAALARMSHVQMGLAPKNLEEGFRLAEMLAKSTIIPKEFQGNAGNILIAMQMGMEIGLAPMQSLQSICVINGRPSIWGDGLLALVQASGLLEDIAETLDAGVATCTVQRKNWKNPVSRSFSIEDAKRANLWNKSGPWQTNPNRMLQMRARAFALRDVFADVLRGLASAEEMLDVTAQATAPPEKVDPAAALKRELACSEEQFAHLTDLWDNRGIPAAQRLVAAKQYAGRAPALIVKLLTPDQAPGELPAAPTVTPHARKRLAKAKAEGTAPSPEAQAESLVAALDPAAVCLHGVDIHPSVVCAECKQIEAELDAEAAQQETTLPKGATPPEKQESAAEYAARRKKELAALNAAPLPNVAPKEKAPF